MDFTSLVGVFFGIVCILIGQAMEGGNVGQLLQITAAFIVFGGTGGAVILSFSVEELKNALLLLKDVFMGEKVNFDELIAEIIKFATKARLSLGCPLIISFGVTNLRHFILSAS